MSGGGEASFVYLKLVDVLDSLDGLKNGLKVECGIESIEEALKRRCLVVTLEITCGGEVFTHFTLKPQFGKRLFVVRRDSPTSYREIYVPKINAQELDGKRILERIDRGIEEIVSEVERLRSQELPNLFSCLKLERFGVWVGKFFEVRVVFPFKNWRTLMDITVSSDLNYFSEGLRFFGDRTLKECLEELVGRKVPSVVVRLKDDGALDQVMIKDEECNAFKED